MRFGTLSEQARFRIEDFLPAGKPPQLPPPPPPPPPTTPTTTTPTTTATTTPAPVELPDLVIDSLSQFSFTVVNLGKAPAGEFLVDVTGVGNFKIAGLASGDKAEMTWKTCKPGTITATADSTGLDPGDGRGEQHPLLHDPQVLTDSQSPEPASLRQRLG